LTATRTIEGVIFDLDGTLYSLSALKVRMTFVLLRSLSVLRRLSRARKFIRPREFVDGRELERAFCTEIARRSGITLPQAEAWYRDEFLQTFVALLGRYGQRRPGLLELLARLRMGGVKLAVVSDFPLVAERLKALGIPPEAFHDLASSEEIGSLKPAPRSLLVVAQRWGLDPATILVVGDRPNLDEDCARAARMEFLGINDKARAKGRTREYVHWERAMEIIASRTGIGESE